MRTRPLVMVCLLLSALCLISVARAQTSWWRTYGGTDEELCGYSVQQTSDGGYVIAGSTYSFGAGGYDVYLVKTNTSGDILWTRTCGGTDHDHGYSVQQTSDGGYIIAGYTLSFGAGDYDFYLIKTNASGDTLWTRTYGGTDAECGYSVQQTSDGGFIITGDTRSFGAGNSDVYLIKTDASGDTLWTRAHGGTEYDYGRSVQQTSDGGYIVAGYTITGDTSSFGVRQYDVYLIKTNASGDTLWTRTYGGTDHDRGYSVQQTSDGGFIIAGYTLSFGTGGDVYLIKTNVSGDTLWTRTHGGTDFDEGRSVQQTSDGGYIIAGTTWWSIGAGYEDVYLIKTNASGDALWTSAYGGEWGDEGRSVQQTSDGGYIVAGYTGSFGMGGDLYLIKTDPLGSVGVAEESPKPQGLSRKPAATAVRDLPLGATAFDAMGRRVSNPKPGIYFLRTTATTTPRKVLLVR